eukprot:3851243-Prymnesium_polylepis.1
MTLRAALVLPMNTILSLRPQSDSGRGGAEFWHAPAEEAMCSRSSDDSRGALRCTLVEEGIRTTAYTVVALVKQRSHAVQHDVGDARQHTTVTRGKGRSGTTRS